MAGVPENAYHPDMSKALGMVAILSFLGCGGGGDGAAAISSAPLSGKIGGQPWTFGTGESNSSLSDDSTFWVEAYADSFTPCTGAAPADVHYLILNLPRTTGTHSLGIELTETFYVGNNDNLATANGTIVIQSVTATTITGGAKFAYNADNSVDGQFTATICP